MGLAKDRIQLSWWFDNKQFKIHPYRSLSGGQGAATATHVTLALRRLCTYLHLYAMCSYSSSTERGAGNLEQSQNK